MSGIDGIRQNTCDCSAFPCVIGGKVFISFMPVQNFSDFGRAIFFIERQVIDITDNLCFFRDNDKMV